jgi:diguanylate cyclase (GGDEF)-like protein
VGGSLSERPDADPRERELNALRRENLALSRAITLLHRISNLVRTAQELEPTCYALLTGVTAGVGLGMNRAAIFLCDEEVGLLRGMAAVGPMDHEEADRVWKAIEADAPDLAELYEAGLAERAQRGRFDRHVRAMIVDPRGESPLAMALRESRLIVGEGRDDLGGTFHLPTVVAAPLRGRSRIRGVLVADCRFTERAPDGATRLVLDLLADHAGLAVESAERYERLAREARTDALTGLGSRRAFDARLLELARSPERGEGTLGLLMMDLDDFKRLNDTHGHPVGDRVLAEVGRRLSAVLRAGEAFRYGGEELAVLLSGVTFEGLRSAAERVHGALVREPVAFGELSLPVGVSLGAALLAPGGDAAELVHAADQALLAAKAAGKNQVRLG